MTRSLLLRLVPMALLAAPATAVAASAAPGGATFSGSCTLSGTVRFDPPLTTTPQPTVSTATAGGTCSGTLTEPDGSTQSLSSAPVAYQATEDAASASCGSGIDSGSGSITLARFTFPFSVDEYRATGAAVLHLTGTEGGAAVVDAQVSANADQATILSDCAGPGLPEAPIDGDLQTTSPLVSAAGGGHDGHRSAPAAHRDLVAAAAGTPLVAPGAVGLPLTTAAGAPAPAGGAALAALAGVAVVARRARRR